MYLKSSLLLLTSLSLYAGEDCDDLLKKVLLKVDSNEQIVEINQHVNHRQFIANFAKKNGVPVFYKQNNIGEEVPVILINSSNYKKMKNYIENSYGTEVVLQPGYNNDHGLLRTGNFIIDVDAPGYRGYGELHDTGIAWKNFDEYLMRRTTQSGTILEVSYLLTADEKLAVDFYQRVRRAAIFRVKFSFNGFKTEDHPFLLENGAEHCFIFCKAQAVTTHINEIRGNLVKMGLSNPDEYLSKDEVKSALDYTKTKLMNTSPMVLSPYVVETDEIVAMFAKIFPDTLKNKRQQLDFIKWIISYDSSKNYNQVLKNLGVSSDYGIGDFRNKRVSAVLVYDEKAVADEFNKGNYTNKGAFTNWPMGNQRPVE